MYNCKLEFVNELVLLTVLLTIKYQLANTPIIILWGIAIFDGATYSSSPSSGGSMLGKNEM